jgi:hypothetical protein
VAQKGWSVSQECSIGAKTVAERWCQQLSNGCHSVHLNMQGILGMHAVQLTVLTSLIACISRSHYGAMQVTHVMQVTPLTSLIACISRSGTMMVTLTSCRDVSELQGWRATHGCLS